MTETEAEQLAYVEDRIREVVAGFQEGRITREQANKLLGPLFNQAQVLIGEEEIPRFRDAAAVQ